MVSVPSSKGVELVRDFIFSIYISDDCSFPTARIANASSLVGTSYGFPPNALIEFDRLAPILVMLDKEKEKLHRQRVILQVTNLVASVLACRSLGGHLTGSSGESKASVRESSAIDELDNIQRAMFVSNVVSGCESKVASILGPENIEFVLIEITSTASSDAMTMNALTGWSPYLDLVYMSFVVHLQSHLEASKSGSGSTDASRSIYKPVLAPADIGSAKSIGTCTK